jgi:hypothetical protein
MNLARHVAVVWRFRRIVIAAGLLGIALAVLAAYKVSPSGLERRGIESWSSESQILVTQPGCPECRVTLPPVAAPGEAGSSTPATRGEQTFADPGRLASLAMLYSVLSNSDRVLQSLPEKPDRDQIEALPFDATGNGTTFLPIIKLTTLAGSATAAEELNVHAYKAFRETLTADQRRNDIPVEQRIQLNVLKRPAAPILVSGPSLVPSVLALMLCLIAGLAAAHILESLRTRPSSEAFASSYDVADLDAAHDHQFAAPVGATWNGDGYAGQPDDDRAGQPPYR